MKKLFILSFLVAVSSLVMAQQDSVVNGVLQFSPHTFMVLPANPSSPTQNDWVKCWWASNLPTTSSSSPSWQQGIENPGSQTNRSHRIYSATSQQQAQNDRDCLSCYPLGTGYQKNLKFPPSWNSDTNAGNLELQYMQLGYVGGNDKAQRIEYKFKVSEDRSVLLLNFSLVMENPSHPWTSNPYLDIQLLGENGSTLLNLGRYPNDYNTNGNLNAGGTGNANWPYARFFVQAFGSGASQNFQTPSTITDASHHFSTMVLQECPQSAQQQLGCSGASYNTINSYPYTIVAYNLKNYIDQVVILRVVTVGCGYSGHYSYARYTAKMVPHKLLVKYCSGDDHMDLSIPWGFDETHSFKSGVNPGYRWLNGADSLGAQWFDPTDMEDPRVLGGSTTFRPVLLPDPAKPYYRCEVTSQTGVPFIYEATVNYYDLQPGFTAQARVNTDHPDCSYTVEVTNTSKIGVIVPDGNGGVDTLWQQLSTQGDQCTWNFGDGTPDVTGFEPTHTYAQPGTYTISLHINDYERICVSHDTSQVVTIEEDFNKIHYAQDTVSTCESKLPYYYKPEIFGTGDLTTWNLNAVGDHNVNYSNALPDYHIRSYNGCDSIVKVRFDVLTPTVIIEQVGQDFCDSAQTILQAFVSNADEDAISYEWTFMDSIMSRTDIIEAIADGTYSVSIVDTNTGCAAANLYKIDPCIPNIFLPNCITPTDDRNDLFQNDYVYLDQFVLRFITDIKFSVYARNGQQVYYYEGRKNAAGEFEPTPQFSNLPTAMDNRLVLWDGRNGTKVVTGTYTYTLWIVSGKQQYLYKGSITVL